jgi:hypothetical protein
VPYTSKVTKETFLGMATGAHDATGVATAASCLSSAGRGGRLGQG